MTILAGTPISAAALGHHVVSLGKAASLEGLRRLWVAVTSGRISVTAGSSAIERKSPCYRKDNVSWTFTPHLLASPSWPPPRSPQSSSSPLLETPTKVSYGSGRARRPKMNLPHKLVSVVLRCKAYCKVWLLFRRFITCNFIFVTRWRLR